MRFLWAYTLIFCLLMISINCNKEDDTAKGDKIAKIGDRIIYKKVVDDQIDKIMSSMPAGQMPEAEKAKLRQQYFDQIKDNEITKAILLEKASEEDKDKGSDEKVSDYITKIRANFPDSQSFATRLQQNGTTLEKLKIDVKDQLIIESIIARITSAVDSLPVDSMQAYYDLHQEEFKSEEQYRASHILLKLDSTDTDATKKAKHDKLTSILAELKKGKDFASLAKAHSNCPSSKEGGDLRYFGRGQMVKPFEEAVMALQLNEISDVVETQFGYHIIKLTDHKISSIQPFEEVKQSISGKMKNLRLQDWIEVQKKELKVVDYTLVQPK